MFINLLCLDLWGEIELGINGRVLVAGGAAGVSCGRRSGSSTALKPARPPHCVPKLQAVREVQTYLRMAATRCTRNRGDCWGCGWRCTLGRRWHPCRRRDTPAESATYSWVETALPVAGLHSEKQWDNYCNFMLNSVLSFRYFNFSFYCFYYQFGL